MTGSWAGAMGHTQFLPSKYLTTAIDRDKSGSADIWNSLPDVFASTANHLKEDKWLPAIPWGMEVILPKNFAYQEAELDRSFPVGHWQKMGVKTVDGKQLPPLKGDTSILLLAGKRGPAFLISQNFKALLGYNYSTSYALAVSYLSEAIASRGAIRSDWPRQDPPLSLAERIELQRLLGKLGFFKGKEDGVIGLGTRRAIRAFQLREKYPGDGYADKALLALLRKAS
jgi:membrane-bound lytic murein transglycosylase B